MLRWLGAAVLVVALAGCALEPVLPLPAEMVLPAADATAADSARLQVQLVYSFDAAGPDAVLNRLADPNERVALAAARSAGRWAMRKDAQLSQRAADGLAEAMAHETRPAVLVGQVDSAVNLIADRQGLAGGADATGLDLSKPLAALRELAAREGDGLGAARATASVFLKAWADPSHAKLGENVYDGVGWKSPLPVKIPPARRVERYREPIHTVPVVAAGEVHLGDVTGDGAKDYLIIDTGERRDGLHVRLSLYDHSDAMLGSVPLVGDDRPITFPPGELADINGDGRAEIVYADRAGRIVVRGGSSAVLLRSDPFRTLDGAAYFAGPDGAKGRLWLADLRGAGRRDLLLTSESNVLALTGDLQRLWHVCLPVYGRNDEPMLLGDLDGDGRDEIVRGNVAIDHAGRVLWVWPHEVKAGAVCDALRGNSRRLVLLVDSAGTVAAFDDLGLLWTAVVAADVRQIVAGRFFSPLGDRLAGFARGPGGERSGQLLDGLGGPDLASLRRPADAKGPVVQLHPAGLVCDWDGDGIDEVWACDQAEKAGIFGWFKWPYGPAVQKIPMDGALVGLADVDGDGVDELLYFQGNSLVIQRKKSGQ